MDSFQSILEDIDKHVQSLEWKTDKNDTLHGVLHKNENRVLLNVNSKELKSTINFDYIYHKSEMSGRRVLYPFDFQGSKSIPHTSLSDNWPVEVAMIIDERKIPEVVADTQISYAFESFLWHKVPESTQEKDEFDKQMAEISELDTAIGKVTVSINGTESHSNHPSRIEKNMDRIVVSLDANEELSNRDILMWHVRFSQFLTFIHRERLVPVAIHRGLDNVLVPNLVDDYKEANYAFRQPVGLDEFVIFIKQALPAFVNQYEDTAGLFEDLVQYYRDYPLDPPDDIQLLRLFSGLEQCFNHFDSQTPKSIKNSLSSEEELRDKDFDNLLNSIKADKSVSLELKDYLKDKSKKYYVRPEIPSSAKNKIVALAEFIVNTIGIFSYLKDPDNAKTVWSMRTTLAHGFYDKKARDTFYARRDDFGQDIEQSIRVYTMYVLGVDKDTIIKHKEPLKARRFNGI